MWINFFLVTCFCYLTLTAFNVNAQDIDSLMNLSAFTEESELQKIINKNVSVSSQKVLTTRETPGIVSLVTSEEIQNSGARGKKCFERFNVKREQLLPATTTHLLLRNKSKRGCV